MAGSIRRSVFSRESRIAFALAGSLLLAGVAGAVPIPGLFDTGTGGIGAPDPDYSLVASPLNPVPPAIGMNKHPLWVAPPPGSNWIGVSVDAAGGVDPVGFYDYLLELDLTGLDFTTAGITGDWATDNNGEIFLNGVSTGILKPFGGFTILDSFSIVSGFQAGSNTLLFRVFNAGGVGDNPTGLLVANLQGTADPEEPPPPPPPPPPIPEPSILALLAAGFGSLGWMRFRRRNP